jgi:high-affinity Fe2+/Pb2+ permease
MYFILGVYGHVIIIVMLAFACKEYSSRLTSTAAKQILLLKYLSQFLYYYNFEETEQTAFLLYKYCYQA